jgi:hypothetical protein
MLAASLSVISGSEMFVVKVLSITWVIESARDCSLHTSSIPGGPWRLLLVPPHNDPDARGLRRAIPLRKRWLSPEARLGRLRQVLRSPISRRQPIPVALDRRYAAC